MKLFILAVLLPFMMNLIETNMITTIEQENMCQSFGI